MDSLLKFLPLDVKVIDSNNVTNTFHTEEELASDDIIKDPIPLFSIDLILSEEDRPIFNVSPSDIVITLMLIFDNGLKNLQEINQPEQKLLPHLFKTNIKNFLKATIRPDFRPDEPDPYDKRTMEDENAWVFEAYFKLKESFEKAIEPLDLYKQTYDKYDKEYKLDPEAYIKKIDIEDNPPEIDFLKKDVVYHKEEA